MYYYNIEIKIEPEYFSTSPKYFWCITKNMLGSASNYGHGWSSSIEQAAIDALSYYNKNIMA